MVVYKKFVDPRTKAYEIYPVPAGRDPRIAAEQQGLQEGEWDIADDELQLNAKLIRINRSARFRLRIAKFVL